MCDNDDTRYEEYREFHDYDRDRESQWGEPINDIDAMSNSLDDADILADQHDSEQTTGNVRHGVFAPVLTHNSVVNLFNHPGGVSEGRTEQEKIDILNERYAEKPIIHRLRQDYRSGTLVWATQSVSVQNAAMRQVLDKIFKDCPDLDVGLRGYQFNAPYTHFCHKWDELEQFSQGSVDLYLKNAASGLLQVLRPLVDPTIRSMREVRENGQIGFDNLWQLFPTGALVITGSLSRSVPIIGLVVSLEDGFNPVTKAPRKLVQLKVLKSNGSEVGLETMTRHIESYSGVERVVHLGVYPVSFLGADEKGFKKMMIQRGRKIEDITMHGWKYMTTCGSKYPLEGDTKKKQHTNGKVCIDAGAYYDVCNIPKPKLERVCSIGTPEQQAASKLTDGQCMLFWPWVIGFDLGTKDFCNLCVDQLQPYSWNEVAFEKLVLPSEDKTLVWEFFSAKKILSRNKESFDDFVADKGRGFIMLMYGPPGVGKTFTAEAVAEKSKSPIYMLGADDLGTSVTTITASLGRALKLCSRWDAMLLLDEADVYMASRESGSLAQNELVSLFLRQLEYYPGPLALTTNRLEFIDAAFLSRVDLLLPYSDLTTEARREIWSSFLNRAGRDHFDITDEALDRLARYPFNGREIKNLVKSAKMLQAFHGDSKVPMDRLYLLADKRLQAEQQWNSVDM